MIYEMLGIRGGVVMMTVHFLAGVVLVGIGINLFIAMPILSTRSGVVFARTRQLLSLLFDTSAITGSWSSGSSALAPALDPIDLLHLLQGYSLMVDGLTPADSLRLLEQGLGQHRRLGCGVFVAHQSTAAVGTPQW